MVTNEPQPRVQVHPASFDADVRVLALEGHGEAEILVLPFSIIDGIGRYSESSVSLVKLLRASGARASFAHPSDRRTFEVKKSDPASLAIAFIVGIASSAAWDVLKSLWSATFRQQQRLDVTYVELEDGPRRGQAWQIQGDAESVIRAISELRERPQGDD